LKGSVWPQEIVFVAGKYLFSKKLLGILELLVVFYSYIIGIVFPQTRLPRINMKISRREFFQYSALTLGAGVSSVLAYAALKNELLNPIVEHISIPIKDLPPSMKGFRIVQISDIHLKPIVTLNLVRKTVAMVNTLQPDLIVITGDFVTRFISAIYELGPVLAQLRASYGVFASLGNHDLWTDAAVITQVLNNSGVHVLINQGTPVSIDGETLWLAGVDDAISGQPNLYGALRGMPYEAPVVLLGHEPDPADEFSQDGRVNLMLTGHSHGGQIRIPGFGSPSNSDPRFRFALQSSPCGEIRYGFI